MTHPRSDADNEGLPTDAQIIAALEWSLEWMRKHGVDGLSPFKDYPPVKETIRGMYQVMVAAAPPPDTGGVREALLPFANLANGYDDEIDSDDRPVGPVALKFCRAARTALPTTPCTSGGREAIARIIDSDAFVDAARLGFTESEKLNSAWQQQQNKKTALAKADRILALTGQNSGPTAGREEVTIWESVSKNVKERLGENEGAWRSCSGCYEMEDGQNVHGYPHSDVFGCELGGGCSECGGIGAIWDTTDYAAMGDELSLEWIAKQSEAEGARVADLALVAKNALSPSFDKSEGGK